MRNIDIYISEWMNIRLKNNWQVPCIRLHQRLTSALTINHLEWFITQLENAIIERIIVNRVSSFLSVEIKIEIQRKWSKVMHIGFCLQNKNTRVDWFQRITNFNRWGKNEKSFTSSKTCRKLSSRVYDSVKVWWI